MLILKIILNYVSLKKSLSVKHTILPHTKKKILPQPPPAVK